MKLKTADIPWQQGRGTDSRWCYAVVQLRFKRFDPVKNISAPSVLVRLEEKNPGFIYPIEYNWIGKIEIRKELSEFRILRYIDMDPT